jgi:hypothetical protein
MVATVPVSARAKFVKNLPQNPSARREWVAVVLNDVVKLADQSGCFFVRWQFAAPNDRTS